jgi:hypothetical protein
MEKQVPNDSVSSPRAKEERFFILEKLCKEFDPFLGPPSTYIQDLMAQAKIEIKDLDPFQITNLLLSELENEREKVSTTQ